MVKVKGNEALSGEGIKWWGLLEEQPDSLSFSCYCCFVFLGVALLHIEPRVLHMLQKHFTTEIHPEPIISFYFFIFIFGTKD